MGARDLKGVLSVQKGGKGSGQRGDLMINKIAEHDEGKMIAVILTINSSTHLYEASPVS